MSAAPLMAADRSDRRWRLRCCGAPRLLPPGGASEALPLARKDAALLAYVVLQGAVPSAQAAQLLWPSAGGRGGLNNLRQRLHRLRKATGARLLEMTDGLAPANDLEAQALPAHAALEADAAAWDGELLGAFDYDDAPDFAAWLADARKAWRTQRRDALAAIASAAETQGATARAIVYAERLLADDLLSEHAHRRLMRLHYLRGDVAAAVAAFERCERTLKDELGLAPGAETVQLLQTIERSRGVVALPSSAPQPVPAALARPPLLVGRAAAVAALDEAAQRAQVAVVVGEAGIGKTRLLQELVTSHGAAALHVRARPGDAGVPYALLARLLRALLAAFELPPPQHDDGAALEVVLAPAAAGPLPTTTARMRAALETLLTHAGERGLALVAADDLHFADPASIEMLLALVNAERLRALRWVLAHRPLDAAEADAALLRALASSPEARWIELPPLDEPALHELIASLALPGLDAERIAPALARHTGGNPLYVIETLRAWLAARHDEPRLPQGDAAEAARAGLLPRPAALAHILDERLRRLSRPAMALARTAAVAVPDFSIELAERVLGVPALALADAWRELEAAQVLAGTSFAHDLVHDAMRRATPQVLAAHTHGQVAAFLAERGAEPARVAEHWQRAGEPSRAALAWRAAAQRAQAAARAREQAQLLLAAARAHAEAGEADAAATARADAVSPLLQGESTAQALALAQQLVQESAGLPRGLQARLHAMHAKACLWSGQVPECEAAGRKALELADGADEVTRVEATCNVAQACGMQGRPEEGLALLLPWQERLHSLADANHRVEFASAFENLAIQADRPREALVWTRRHLQWAEQCGDLLGQMTACLNLAADAMRRGELEAGIEYTHAAARRVPESQQARALAGWNESLRGYLLCGVGRYREAIDVLERELAQTAGAPSALRTLQEQWLAQVWITLGQPARAHQLLGQDESVPAGYGRAKRLLARAQLAAASGGDERALLEQARAEATRPNARFEWIMIRLRQARHAPPLEALALAEELAQMAQERGFGPLAAGAEATAVQACIALGRSEAAAAAAERLQALAQQCRSPAFYHPELMRCAAAGFEAAQRTQDAQRCVLEALHWIHAVALPNLPPAFVPAFTTRNEVNAELLARRR